MIFSQRTLFISLLCAGLAAACGDGKDDPVIETSHPSRPGAGAAAVAADPVDLFLQGLRAYNEGNLEDLLAVYTEDSFWHIPNAIAPPVRSAKAIARALVKFKTKLPESKLRARRIIETDGLIVAQVVLEGVRRYDDQGIEMKKPVPFGAEILYVVQSAADGRAKGTLMYMDQAVLNRQLGIDKSSDPAPLPKKTTGDPVRVKGEAGDGDANAKVVGTVFDAWAAADYEKLAGLVAEGFVYRDTRYGSEWSFEELEGYHEKERKVLSDVEYDIKQTISAGDLVIARFAMKAVVDRDGKKTPVTIHGANVFELKGGKIAAVESYSSDRELQVQLKRAGASEPEAKAADGAVDGGRPDEHPVPAGEELDAEEDRPEGAAPVKEEGGSKVPKVD